MREISKTAFRVMVAAFSTSILAATAPQVSAKPAAAILNCDNGHSYRLQARAISGDGDLVTGYLMTGPHGSHYLRLMPVGFGYRYAGAGIWLDGHKDLGILNFGLGRSTACSVAVGS